MALRYYQEKASLDVRKALPKYKIILLCGPTGSGKTVSATDFAERAVSKGLVVVFLCDREELIEQTANKFIGSGLDFNIVDSSSKYIRRHTCHIGMVETFYRRISAGRMANEKVDLFILDEAHMGNYRKVLEWIEKNYPEAFAIGLTATPVSSAVNYPLKKYFKHIVIAETNKNLIKKGYLVPAIEIGNNQLLNFRVVNGEFDNQSQVDQWKNYHVDSKMISLWKRYAHDRQTICYCINIEHSKNVVKLFENEGVKVERVDSDTPKDYRKQVFWSYQRGDIQVLVNVGIYTKGTDSPQTSCIIENFATGSTSKHHQVIGRGGRPHKGKKDFILIDMAQNCLRHGSFNEDIDWKYLFEHEERDKNFTVRIKVALCPVCYTYHHNKFIIECPTCGTNLEKNKLISLENLMPDWMEQTPIDKMTFKQLTDYAKFKGYKRGWAWTQRFGRTFKERRIAQ